MVTLPPALLPTHLQSVARPSEQRLLLDMQQECAADLEMRAAGGLGLQERGPGSLHLFYERFPFIEYERIIVHVTS